jgi:hypothetical protein
MIEVNIKGVLCITEPRKTFLGKKNIILLLIFT